MIVVILGSDSRWCWVFAICQGFYSSVRKRTSRRGWPVLAAVWKAGINGITSWLHTQSLTWKPKTCIPEMQGEAQKSHQLVDPSHALWMCLPLLILSGARKQRLDELDDIRRYDIASGLGWKDAKKSACQKEHTHGIPSCIACVCTCDHACFDPGALSLAHW